MGHLLARTAVLCMRTFFRVFLTMELEYSKQALIFALILCGLETDKELSQHMALKWVDCRHIVCQSKRQYCNQGRPCLPVCTSDGSGTTPAVRSASLHCSTKELFGTGALLYEKWWLVCNYDYWNNIIFQSVILQKFSYYWKLNDCRHTNCQNNISNERDVQNVQGGTINM